MTKTVSDDPQTLPCGCYIRPDLAEPRLWFCGDHGAGHGDSTAARALLRLGVEPSAEPVQYALEERCECGLTWRVHSGYAFDVKEIQCHCGRKVSVNRAALNRSGES